MSHWRFPRESAERRPPCASPPDGVRLISLEYSPATESQAPRPHLRGLSCCPLGQERAGAARICYASLQTEYEPCTHVFEPQRLVPARLPWRGGASRAGMDDA